MAALFAVALGLVLPDAIRRHRVQSRAASRIEAIAAWAEMLRDAMAGAAGLESALVATAPAAPLAIRSDVQELAASLTGERIGTALRHFADRVADPTCDLVVAALLMAAEHQGRQLGELLGALAASAREDAAMRLRVEAGRAQIRGDLQIIVITVFGFVTMLLLVDPCVLHTLRLASGAAGARGDRRDLRGCARVAASAGAALHPHRLLVARSEETR